MMIPDEETAAKAEPFMRLVERLNVKSVEKHHDTFVDIAWDDPAMRIDASDPRWELPADSTLGATAWYRGLPQPVRARLGLTGLQDFEQAFRKNAAHRQSMIDWLGKVRDLCEELGLYDERSRRLRRTLGVA
jgi:hypothetical protein